MATVAGPASWLALLAATSLSGVQAETVRAQIRAPANAAAAGKRYRLVVQSYDQVVRPSLIPGAMRPRGSTQRSVSGDDLARGVEVDLVELSDAPATVVANGTGKGTIVAWVELGEADLAFDGRQARPSPGCLYAVGSSGGGERRGVELYLDQRVRQTQF